MPLACAGWQAMDLYPVSFIESILPGCSLGYLVAIEDIIGHLPNCFHIIDRQGDHRLENAIAQLLNEGIIQK